MFWAPVVAALDGDPEGPRALQRIFEYLGEAAGERSTDLELLAATITEHTPAARDVTMNSLEKLLEKGRKQGVVIGRAQANRETLLKQLRAKFGGLTGEDAAKIAHADAATLEEYLERILTADSVAAVLGG